MKKIYLACPYWHNDEGVRQSRYESVNSHAANLMEQGYVVFSPISHSHPIQQYMEQKDHTFWLDGQDLHWLRLCDELWIIMLPGYASSKGIKAEIAEARRLGRAIRFVEEGEVNRKWQK